LMFIIENEEGIPVGTIGLDNIDHKNAVAEYGRKIIGEDEYLGRGYATDAGRTLARFAFQQMNLNRLYMDTLADNEATIHVCEKVGFRLEGTLREAVFLDGAYHDILVMAMLRREWQEREVACS
jgi:diamine N-acetyltransferase